MSRRLRHHGWDMDREAVDVYISITTDGVNAFGDEVGLGATLLRTGVGTATLQLTESDGTALAVSAMLYASADLQLNAAPGAAAAYKARPVAKSAANGTVTFRCEDSAGGAVEWPAANANNQLNVHVRFRDTSVMT